MPWRPCSPAGGATSFATRAMAGTPTRPAQTISSGTSKSSATGSMTSRRPTRILKPALARRNTPPHPGARSFAAPPKSPAARAAATDSPPGGRDGVVRFAGQSGSAWWMHPPRQLHRSSHDLGRTVTQPRPELSPPSLDSAVTEGAASRRPGSGRLAPGPGVVRPPEGPAVFWFCFSKEAGGVFNGE